MFIFICFHSATLCVSAALAVGRCQSIRPSVCVTFGFCIQTAEDIVKRLFQPSFYFWTPTADSQFRREPFIWDAKYIRVGKIRDFRLKSPFISETA